MQVYSGPDRRYARTAHQDVRAVAPDSGWDDCCRLDFGGGRCEDAADQGPLNRLINEQF